MSKFTEFVTSEGMVKLRGRSIRAWHDEAGAWLEDNAIITPGIIKAAVTLPCNIPVPERGILIGWLVKKGFISDFGYDTHQNGWVSDYKGSCVVTIDNEVYTCIGTGPAGNASVLYTTGSVNIVRGCV